MRQPGSIRAEAERRGVSVARVQRERARARTEDTQLEPELARQVHYLVTVLGQPEAVVASLLGITEATVARALASPALIGHSMPDPRPRSASPALPRARWPR